MANRFKLEFYRSDYDGEFRYVLRDSQGEKYSSHRDFGSPWEAEAEAMRLDPEGFYRSQDYTDAESDTLAGKP